MNNINRFMEVYKENLEKTLAARNVVWPAEKLQSFCDSMKKTILEGNYNKDQPAFLLTTRQLGAPKTYKDQNKWFKE